MINRYPIPEKNFSCHKW